MSNDIANRGEILLYDITISILETVRQDTMYNSKKATRFRQWATKTLKEYIQKGFVLEKNDAQMLPLFRNWNDFDYHIDLSTCTNIPNGLQNATLTIRDPQSPKIVWTLSI